MNPKLILVILMIIAVTAFASNTPYKGEQYREIKALSEGEIDGLLNGHGMGFAKAAELNHYPGPKHVLELADDLNLTSEQIAETTNIFNRMKTEAVRLGNELVDGEADLNSLFEKQTITYENLGTHLSELERIRAQLRGVHLKAHLAQRRILTTHQLHLYDKLRGYSDDGMDHSHHGELHNQ